MKFGFNLAQVSQVTFANDNSKQNYKQMNSNFLEVINRHAPFKKRKLK